METRSISGAGAVEVLNVDLNNLSNQQTSGILDLYRENVAMVFRDQNLSPDSQLRFTELFGPVMSHPLRTRATPEGYPQILILENRPGLRGAPNDYWHSDISHSETPPSATVLHSLTVPQGYGDTLVCNMVRAYEQLSEPVRKMVENLRALHSGLPTYERSVALSTDARKIDPAEVKPPYSHPVVRAVEGTDQKAIFINPRFTTAIEGVDKDVSDFLMRHLIDKATRPENVYRHQWRPGDVLLWDNRRTMHYAVLDYSEDMPRKMHRATAGGENPQDAVKAA